MIFSKDFLRLFSATAPLLKSCVFGFRWSVLRMPLQIGSLKLVVELLSRETVHKFCMLLISRQKTSNRMVWETQRYGAFHPGMTLDSRNSLCVQWFTRVPILTRFSQNYLQSKIRFDIRVDFSIHEKTIGRTKQSCFEQIIFLGWVGCLPRTFGTMPPLVRDSAQWFLSNEEDFKWIELNETKFRYDEMICPKPANKVGADQRWLAKWSLGSLHALGLQISLFPSSKSRFSYSCFKRIRMKPNFKTMKCMLLKYFQRFGVQKNPEICLTPQEKEDSAWPQKSLETSILVRKAPHNRLRPWLAISRWDFQGF